MLPKELNTLETFFKILDKFYPDWEKRADDYYLTEIAFLILRVFNSPYTDETIINNLRVMNVSKYDKELAKIYALPIEAYKWIMQKQNEAGQSKGERKTICKKCNAKSKLRIQKIHFAKTRNGKS